MSLADWIFLIGTVVGLCILFGGFFLAFGSSGNNKAKNRVKER